MKSPVITPWLAKQGDFTSRSHGRIRVRECTFSFGFQIHARQDIRRPSLMFALSQIAERTHRTVEFGVRVDLDSGEIHDIANKTGIIGQLEHDLWPSEDEEFPLILRWEVEHTGSALIPRLHIGSEEWLYPSVLFPGESSFEAMTGYNMSKAEGGSLFSPGYVWCQDRLEH